VKTIRNILAAGACTVAVALYATTGLLAQELRLAHFSPPTHFLHTHVFVPFAKAVNEETKGSLSVRIFPAGELGAGPAEQLNRALNGIADIALVLPGYNTSQFPMTLVAELPGASPDPKTGTERLWESTDLLADEYSKVKMLALWVTDPAILMMRDVPVNSLADLKGKKIRVPSANAAAVVEAWGAAPVFMPSVDLYNSLQTGVIDGMIGSVTLVANYRLDEVLKYYILGIPPTFTSMNLAMNQARWNSLSDDQKAVLAKLGREMVSNEATRLYAAEAEEVTGRLRAAPNETVIELSQDARAEFAKTAEPVVAAILKRLDDGGHKASQLAEKLK